MRQRWSPERIIAEIQALAGPDGTVRTTREHDLLRKAAEYHFGSWAAACRAAGVRNDLPYKASPAVTRQRLRWLRARPHLRQRLRLFAMALERGLIRRGGDNPFRGWESAAS